MSTEAKPSRRKFYIPLILMPDNGIFDVGIAFSRSAAEFSLEDAWNRLSAERKNSFRKVIKEVEVEI
jgi:hypothetical protein